MSVPDVALTVRDGALGVVPNLAAQTPLKIGTCQSGTVGTIYSFSDPQTAVNTLGQGQLTESVVRSLAVAGGPCLALPANPSVAGAAGAVTHTGTGTSIMTVSGAPYDAYSVQVKIIAGEANLAAATATMQYSLDGGTTWSATIAVPSSGIYAIPNTGLTITFGAGSLVANDVYSFTCTAPGYALADLTTAINTALASSQAYGFIHVVGPASTASGAASMLASVDTQLATAASNHRYMFAIIEVPQDTDANLETAFTSSSSTRVIAAAGFATLTSPINGRQLSRSAGWPIAERAALVRPGTDLARVADGPLLGVVSISRDERATPGLDDARFATLRTIVGRPGFYINNAKLMAPAGSDFSLLQNRRVMDVFSGALYNALLNFLNDAVLVDSSTGYIQEQSARAIESYCDAQCRSLLTRPGDASDLSVTVDRTTNILSTANLPVHGRVIPNGYNKSISVDVGYSNPALKLS